METEERRPETSDEALRCEMQSYGLVCGNGESQVGTGSYRRQPPTYTRVQVHSHQEVLLIEDQSVTVFLEVFDNKILVFITVCKKLGQFFNVSISKIGTKFIYEVESLLGQVSPILSTFLRAMGEGLVTELKSQNQLSKIQCPTQPGLVGNLNFKEFIISINVPEKILNRDSMRKISTTIATLIQRT